MANGPGFWRSLDGMLAGNTLTETRDSYAATQRAAQERARLEELRAKISKGDPEMEYLLRSNPDIINKALATQYEAANTPGGDTRMYGKLGPKFMAPKVSVDGGVPVVQDEKGATWGGQRPESHQEIINGQVAKANEAKDAARLRYDQFNSDANREVERGKMIETRRTNVAREGISRTNAANSGGGGGGGGGAMPVTMDLAGSLAKAQAALDRRRGGVR